MGTGEDFGPLEAAVMDAVWAGDGPVSVRAVADAVNAGRRKDLAYTTVMTVLSRLTEKGALRRHRHGRRYLYEARADDAAGLAVQDVIRTHGDAALAHFVAEAEADPDVLSRLRRLIEHADD